MELCEGRSLSLPVFNTMSGGVTNVTYTVAGTETVNVPAGEFDAYRVEASGGPQPMTVYLRREAPRIMLRQEYAGMPVGIELTALE